jgi:hypothetical protein
VIAPALREDEPYLRELGAADIMPRNGDLAVAVRRRYPDGVDALLDNVSYAPGAYDAALKDGARVASPNNAAGEGPSRDECAAHPPHTRQARRTNRLGSPSDRAAQRTPATASGVIRQRGRSVPLITYQA